MPKRASGIDHIYVCSPSFEQTIERFLPSNEKGHYHAELKEADSASVIALVKWLNLNDTENRYQDPKDYDAWDLHNNCYMPLIAEGERSLRGPKHFHAVLDAEPSFHRLDQLFSRVQPSGDQVCLYSMEVEYADSVHAQRIQHVGEIWKIGMPTTMDLYRAGLKEEPYFFKDEKAILGRWVWELRKDELLASAADKRLLIIDALLGEEKRFQRLKTRVAMVGSDSDGPKRGGIPDDVKMFVWQRDQGRCVRCGSNQKLEFDHIIPFVMGGSDTERNLQLLCETCNRSKGGNL